MELEELFGIPATFLIDSCALHLPLGEKNLGQAILGRYHYKNIELGDYPKEAENFRDWINLINSNRNIFTIQGVHEEIKNYYDRIYKHCQELFKKRGDPKNIPCMKKIKTAINIVGQPVKDLAKLLGERDIIKRFNEQQKMEFQQYNSEFSKSTYFFMGSQVDKGLVSAGLVLSKTEPVIILSHDNHIRSLSKDLLDEKGKGVNLDLGVYSYLDPQKGWEKSVP